MTVHRTTTRSWPRDRGRPLRDLCRIAREHAAPVHRTLQRLVLLDLRGCVEPGKGAPLSVSNGITPTQLLLGAPANPFMVSQMEPPVHTPFRAALNELVKPSVAQRLEAAMREPRRGRCWRRSAPRAAATCCWIMPGPWPPSSAAAQRPAARRFPAADALDQRLLPPRPGKTGRYRDRRAVRYGDDRLYRRFLGPGARRQAPGGGCDGGPARCCSGTIRRSPTTMSSSCCSTCRSPPATRCRRRQRDAPPAVEQSRRTREAERQALQHPGGLPRGGADRHADADAGADGDRSGSNSATS
jgi:hypothetical protein